MSIIELERITKSYENHVAVDDLSLQVPKGSIYGFIGPNGSGKTTTIRMIMNILYPDKGRILISGKEHAGSRHDNIGYLPEERGLYRKMKVKDLFYWVNAEAMGLVSIDTKTGEVTDAKRVNELQTILVPYVLLLLMFMMLMMSAVPLLTAVMEEKTERIAEVLLGTATPWEFMTGKIIGGLAVSLTTASIYIVGAVFTLNRMNLSDLIPYDVIPWFFIYMILNIVMVGSIMAALGAVCNDSKDAQAMQFPAMLPVIIPLFLMMPIILNPMSSLAVGTSLFPLWTPMLMLLRQSTSVTIPIWQPIVGLVGVVLFTMLCVWAGARIFRSAIILQGKRPKFGALMRFIIKG